jgi:hypothetical protein
MDGAQILVAAIFAALVVPFFIFVFWATSHLKVE